MEVKTVALSALKTYHNNPRKGNIEVIADSLAAFGQYKPITVNKKTNEILAGNHTFEAAKKLGWTDISVAYVDVDEDTAARIVAVDNRAADLGTYDDEKLFDLLSELEDLAHTGYTADQFDDLLASLEEADVPQISVEAVANLREATYATHDPADGDNVKRIPTVNELAERYNQRATRMVILDYQNDTYIWVIDKLNEYRKQADLTTNADAVLTLLEAHFKESAPRGE